MNNISFKGFSNIISAYNVSTGGLNTSYIAMKLDDKGGSNDLAKYKQLRKELHYSQGLPNEDVLTLIHVTDGATEDLFIADRGLCLGEQLLYARDKFVPRIFSLKKYKEMEALHLKIYTFLADITKRLSNEKFENEDENIKGVINAIFTNLQKISKVGYALFDQSEAFELTSVGALKQDKFQKTARRFNKKIAETMTEFFRG